MADIIKQLQQSKDYNEYKTNIQKCIDLETEYRKVFAQPDINPSSPCLSDPLCMLYPVYDNYKSFKFRELFPEEMDTPKVFPLQERKKPTDKCISTLDDFKMNLDVLTEGMFRTINWDNIILAGGSVSACLRPVPKEQKEPRKKLRQYFHDKEYSGVDVDLFIYGLNEEQAKLKMIEVAECIEGQLIFPVKFFRTTHSITIVSQYPYINCQVILRLYKSPAEVIMGFDIDSCAVLYNGNQVYCLPRSYNSIVSQYNTVDMSRRSPTYESRLAKYANRGYEVLVPTLQRNKIDPIIYEKSFDKVMGLARLLLLEKFSDPEKRIRYILEKTQSRGRGLSRLMKKVLDTSHIRSQILDIGDRISDYSIVFFPSGPQWTAKKIADLLRTKDRLLNESFYTGEEKEYHTHPCFISDTMSGAFKSGCTKCPEFPPELKEDLKDKYVQGEIEFLKDNPGKQLIGSFHPITDGDWSEGTYLSEYTHKYMELCLDNNINNIDHYLNQYNININTIDSLGRSVLHIIAFINNIPMLKYFLKKKINISQTMSDGRSAFHIACIYGFHEFLELLLEYNSKLPEEERYNLCSLEGAYYLSCLDYSTLFLHPKCVELLFKYGVDAKCVLSEKTGMPNLPTVYLSAYGSSTNPKKCKEILTLFLNHKITSFTIYLQENCYNTIFQLAVNYSFIDYVKILLEIDSTAKDHFKMLSNGISILNKPIDQCNIDMFKLLIDNGADINITQLQIDNYNKWMKKLPPLKYYGRHNILLEHISTPIESILQLSGNQEQLDIKIDMLKYALSKGPIDFVLPKKKINIAQNLSNTIENYKRQLEEAVKNENNNQKSIRKSGFGYRRSGDISTYISSSYKSYLESNKQYEHVQFILKSFDLLKTKSDEIEMEIFNLSSNNSKKRKDEEINNLKLYIEKGEFLLKLLIDNGATKTISQISHQPYYNNQNNIDDNSTSQYYIMIENSNKWEGNISFIPVPESDRNRYVQFYNAIYINDVDTIKKLTNDVNSSEPVLISSRDPLGFNPFLLAIYRGYYDTVELLIDIAIKQYTPNITIEINEKKRLNNIDLVTGLIDNDGEKEITFDPTADFSKIKSQLSHIDILLYYTLLPKDIIHYNNNNNNNSTMEEETISEGINYNNNTNNNTLQEKYNTFTYTIYKKEYNLLNKLIDIIINSDKIIGEKKHKEIKYFESGLVLLSNLFDNLDNNQYGCYNRNYGYHVGSILLNIKNSIISNAIKSKDLKLFKIIVQRLGLCYIIPEPTIEIANYQSCLWVAAAVGNEEILKYLLSNEVLNDLNEFQDNYNPYKNEWKKSNIIDKIKIQFNKDFGKYNTENIIDNNDNNKNNRRYNRYNNRELSYKCILYYACTYKNINNIKVILEDIDKDIDNKYINESLQASMILDNEEIILYLLNKGGKITNIGLNNYISLIPNYPNPHEKNPKSIEYKNYENKYNKYIDEFEKILNLINKDDLKILFDNDDGLLINNIFNKNSIKLINILLKYGYDLKILNKKYQSIAHINAMNFDWYNKITLYFNDIFNKPEYQSLLILEDGHGDIPFDIYTNVYLKQLLTKYQNNNHKSFKEINDFLIKIHPSILNKRILINPDQIRESMQNSSEISQNVGLGKTYYQRNYNQMEEEEYDNENSEDESEEKDSCDEDNNDDKNKIINKLGKKKVDFKVFWTS